MALLLMSDLHFHLLLGRSVTVTDDCDDVSQFHPAKDKHIL